MNVKRIVAPHALYQTEYDGFVLETLRPGECCLCLDANVRHKGSGRPMTKIITVKGAIGFVFSWYLEEVK